LLKQWLPPAEFTHIVNTYHPSHITFLSAVSKVNQSWHQHLRPLDELDMKASRPELEDQCAGAENHQLLLRTLISLSPLEEGH